MMILALVGLSGCDALNKAQDTLDGLLDPVVVEGIVLGVEAPDSPQLDGLLEGSEFEAGTSATVFMADAKEVQEIENAPISGADVTLDGVDIPEVDAGIYLLPPSGSALPYASGETWDLRIVRTSGDNSGTSVAAVFLPEPADFSVEIPQQHTNNTAIPLDFAGLGFDAVLIVVLDDGGNITYSNEPTGIKELYDFTHGSTELGVITIPGDAFPADGLYAVGVAGMVNTDAADLEEMNTGLSAILSGMMRMYPVSTIPLPVP